jgi:DNA processing protein
LIIENFYYFMISNNLKYLIALTTFSKFGPVRLGRIKKYFKNDYERAFKAGAGEMNKAGIEVNIADEFIAFRGNIEVDKITERLDKEGVNIITIDDEQYPKLLKEIYDPPILFYYRGTIVKEEFTLAVVGTRKITAYGQQVTQQIVKELAGNNITIVSGLALGVDTLAHNTAVDNGTRTIAVLGSGLDKQSIYPTSNRYLADKIVAHGGLVISEFPLGTPPLRYNFPQRNRIISGLSLGTLVIEAGEKSGALITARQALDQNREVFAVPGNIYSPVSIGPNLLIKQGAKTITNAGEILEALDLSDITDYIDNKKILPDTAEETQVLANLTHEPVYIDELIRLTKLSAPIINSTLIIMEMKGMVRNLGGMKYVLAR